MAESQKYGKYIGGHFGWQCVLTLEACPSSAYTSNRKPACKACKIARGFKTGKIKIEQEEVQNKDGDSL